MATLAYDLSSRTRVQMLPAMVGSRAPDGTQRFIDYGTGVWYRMDCVVEGLSTSDRETLVAFLETNRTSDIDVDDNGTTYRGKLDPTRLPSWSYNGGRYTVEFTITAQAV